MAVNVYISIFPQTLFDMCSYANFRASSWVQLLYMPMC